MFRGSITALITPFKEGGVDERAFSQFVDWQIGEGSHGLVPCGTTGESPTLSMDEQARLIAITVEASGGRVPVIAGCGSNDTAKAVKLVQQAEAQGADAVLVVAPYYNKPTQEGLYRHFEAVHNASDLPVLIYNIPGRTSVDVSIMTLASLYKDLSNIVGVKDATGDLGRVADQRDVVGAEFCQLSGDDNTALGFNAMGGQGCISVTSNIAPRLCADLQNASLAGDQSTALALQDKLLLLHHALFVETSPGPVKFAAHLLGICEPDMRLPLVQPNETTRAIIATSIAGTGLSPVDFGS